jgi:hypothetical protein
LTLVRRFAALHDCAVFLSTLEPKVSNALAVDESRPLAPALIHGLWFCDGLLLFFLISWVGTTALTLDNDFYYAIFIWSALTFLYRYVRTTNSDVVFWVRARWRSSLFFGVLASIYVAVNVWNANPTERPGGLLLIFEVLWRGVVYGVVDSLVLTAFPLAVALGMFRGDIDGWLRRVGLGVVTLALVWVMSTAYHYGFDQFDEDDLVTPQLTTAVVSLPAVLTVNPVGSIAAQTTLHVAATIRTFESDVFVPPEVEFIPNYEPPGIFGPR